MIRNGLPETPPTRLPDPAPPIAHEEGPLATGERFRPFALAAITVALVALCVVLALPLLPAITWGIALAVLAWPLHTWVRKRLFAHRTGAALLTSVVVTAAIVLPSVFVANQVAREAASAADQVREDQAKGTLSARVAAVPGMSGVLEWVDRAEIDLNAEAQRIVRASLGNGLALAEGSLMAVFQAVIALFILFYALRDRTELLAAVRRLLPLRKPEAERLFDGANDSVFANLYATLVTSAIDGIGTGLMFCAVGLPAPVTWGVVTFVLSFVPILGTYIVWMPAAAYLALSGNWGGAVAMVAFGVASWVVVDNFVYVRVAGQRMHLHEVPALIAFLGGLALFGASGVILGPAILAVTVALLEVWHARATSTELPATGEAGKPEIGRG
ncbi:AI-2E family transporter [Gemmata sp. G18]|uniref:AI-2E family transporter n=1 Tax=Gemmata palustris TaxID=2822762 RepID=A0ABS5C3V2_9BACT|nr:AI-2E family transporter [Gemmata palustris]MBP3960656.1 AI-2E family transporter [Gemmata palustris]